MKQKLKPGDRVKVEFEAEVVAPSYRGTALEVRTVGNGCFEFYDLENLKFTLIEQPIILPEIPGTIVQIDPLDEYGERSVYEYDSLTGDGWWRNSYRGQCTTEYLVKLCPQFGYRVIPAAEAEGVSE